MKNPRIFIQSKDYLSSITYNFKQKLKDEFLESSFKITAKELLF